jgi:Ras-related GTP-binding protein C/D
MGVSYAAFSLAVRSRDHAMMMDDKDGKDGLPRILLLGLKQSGKTSIQRVVLQGVAPHETTFLETTTRIDRKTAKNDFLEFNVWDVPGQEDYTADKTVDLEATLSKCGAIVFVLDCRQSLNQVQTEFNNAVKRLIESVVRIHKIKPTLCVEVFMHKIDSLNEGQQSDLLRRVRSQVHEGVTARIEHKREAALPVNYHLTSIFDSSVFEAFSHVVQHLIVQRGHIASLLELLNTQCKLQHSFLFDLQTRLCLASTGSPHVRDGSQVYELCSDFVEMVKSLQTLYGSNDDGPSGPAPPAYYDDTFRSEVRLQDGEVLKMRVLTKSLIFVAVTQQPDPGIAPIVDHNIDVLRDAVAKMFRIDVPRESQVGTVNVKT